MRRFLAMGILLACAAANAGGVRDPVEPRAAADGGHDGAVVLWGGRIVAHTTLDNRLCVEVSSRSLARDGRPSGYSYDDGQAFLACDASGRVLDLGVASLATFAGNVDRVITQERTSSCATDALDSGQAHRYRHSRKERIDGGCRLWIPVVQVSDTKSWREPPARLPPPTPMWSP